MVVDSCVLAAGPNQLGYVGYRLAGLCHYVGPVDKTEARKLQAEQMSAAYGGSLGSS